MLDPDLTSAIAQFGTAGLIGWMWLIERRAASDRERQLSELHQRIVHERANFDHVVTAIKDNTRALAMLESGQRSLTSLIDRLSNTPTAPKFVEMNLPREP